MARFSAVLFDLDGTLVDEKSSWEWVHDHFGVDNSANVDAYLEGKLDDAAFMASDIALWETANGGPVHISRVAEVLEEAPLMAGAESLLEAVHAAGVPTAIVSGGIDLLAEAVAAQLGIDRWVANSLKLDDKGYLTGEGLCRVHLVDKATPTRTLMVAMGVEPGTAAAVGNSRYDVGMFEAAGFGVAFAPLDDEVVDRADLEAPSRDLADLADVLVGDGHGR